MLRAIEATNKDASQISLHMFGHEVDISQLNLMKAEAMAGHEGARRNAERCGEDVRSCIQGVMLAAQH